MKKWIKVIIILAALGIVTAFIVYKFVYNKPHTDFEKAKTDFAIEAKQIFNEYVSNNESASQKYNGKVLEIEGNFTTIEEVENRVIVIFAFSEGMFGDEGIRCTMLPEYGAKVKAMPAGTSIRIKGFCAGYNDTDVILENCSIIAK